jgi:hypothetical protein
MAVIAKVLPKIATGQPSVNIPVFVGIQIINFPFIDGSTYINSFISAYSRVVLSTYLIKSQQHFLVLQTLYPRVVPSYLPSISPSI